MFLSLVHRLPPVLLALIPFSFVYAHKSFLDNPPPQHDTVRSVLGHRPAVKSQARCLYALVGPIETTLCNYENLESVADDLYYNLHALVQTPYFKYYQVDLYRDCPFWQENGFCMNRECGITSVNESDIPERWRAKSLSKVQVPSEQEINSLPGCYHRDSDYCFLDDLTEGEYIDLTANPERFTGYAGPSSNRVWSSIYKDNCFGISEANFMRSNQPSVSRGVTSSLTGLGLTSPPPTDDPTSQCLEKQVYYKIISGMHASISSHLCYDKLDQRTGKWAPDLQCFIDRVASHPERLQYIYFNTVLLLRAVARIGPYLSVYDYCSGGLDHSEDEAILEKVKNVVNISKSVGMFDETLLFRGNDANLLKAEFKEHFRNVSRIMDCVGCDKCRLWGKIQTTGLGVAMKVLFELDERALEPDTNPHLLQRTEVVALINTLHRFSESLKAYERFREMWEEMQTTSETSSTLLAWMPNNTLLTHFISYLKAALTRKTSDLLKVCEQSVQACMRVVSDIVGTMQGLVRSKDRVPLPDL